MMLPSSGSQNLILYTRGHKDPGDHYLRNTHSKNRRTYNRGTKKWDKHDFTEVNNVQQKG